MIAVIADTHLPKGSRRLPDRCLEVLSEAEAVIHAGDFVRQPALREIEDLCPALHGVHGNVDEPALRLRTRFPNADAVVFGHSHLPLHERDDGFQIFNPGSPTERRRAPRRSMGLLHVGERGLAFEHLWLEESEEG